MTAIRNPYPDFVRRFLKRILPHQWYFTHFGRHEKESLRIWNILASGLSSQDTILDVGAFHGEYSIKARNSNPLAQVYAFEPNPDSAGVLRKNCEGLNVNVVELAVSDTEGVVSFSSSSAMSRIETPTSGYDQDLIQVKAVCLDQWVSNQKVKVGLMKIDVEGAEAAVLRGSQQVLSQHQPGIICEVLSDDAGMHVMQNLPGNYLYYHIDENKGLQKRTSITRKDWRNKNWLFIPRENVEILRNVQVF